MSEAEAPAADLGAAASRSRLKLNRRSLILGVPVLLAVIAAGAWRLGILSPLIGGSQQRPAPPALVQLPEMVANLNSDPKHPRYIKLKAQLETPQSDVAQVQIAMPKLVDIFQTFLREVRPEELQGAMGTYRLRQELIARAAIVLAPAHVTDVLFGEILVQ